MGIGSLTFDQRVTLVLSDVQGMSYSEIAEATGVSVGTVKSRLSRARSSLRDYLLDQGELLPARYRLKGEDQDA
jgi:RNA polymerase sigma-70 factor (ECF subfamily)